MISAVKNFFLTFIIAIFVFIFVAYPIAHFIVINLSETYVEGGEANKPSADDPQGDNDQPGVPSFYGDGGTSTNVLMVLTDYRPSTYSNYDPEVLKRLYGIEKIVPSPSIPKDLAKPAKLSVMSDLTVDYSNYHVADDGSLIFKDGFYEVPYREINATTIILMRIDKERGHTSFTIFPTNAYVMVEGVYVQLADVYAKHGMRFLIDRIHALTGVSIDNYILTSFETFPQLQDALLPGGVSCTVPTNLYLNDPGRDLYISLAMGRRLLDGAGALNLLVFDAYNDAINTQSTTAIRYVREMYSQYTNIINYASAPKSIVKLIDNCDTDFTAEKLLENIDMMFKYSTSQIEINVPTTKKMVGNKVLTIINDDDAIRAFSNFRKIYN